MTPEQLKLADDCELYAKIIEGIVVVANDYQPGDPERREPRETLLKAASFLRTTPDAMVKEALELADKIEGWSPEKWKPLTLNAHERRLAVAALRAITSDARVKEACAVICDKHAEWAENKIQDGDDPASSTSQMWACMSNTANDLAEMIRKDLPPMAAISHQPGTGEVAQKSAPAALGSLPSGESDPSVTLDSAGADTGKMRKLRGSDGETAPPPPALDPATVEAAFLNLCEALGIPATAAAYLDAPKARAALAAKEGA